MSCYRGAWFCCFSGRKTLVLLSNNLEDRLFKPDAALYYTQQLANAGCPTFTILNQGIHATAELPELIGLVSNSTVWAKAFAWMDHYINGVDNGIEAEPPVRLQLRPHSILGEPSKYVTSPVGSTSPFVLVGRDPKSPDKFGKLVPVRVCLCEADRSDPGQIMRRRTTFYGHLPHPRSVLSWSCPLPPPAAPCDRCTACVGSLAWGTPDIDRNLPCSATGRRGRVGTGRPHDKH